MAFDVFMNRMKDEKDRSAKFVSAAAFVNGEESFVHVEHTEGLISGRVEVEK